MSFACSACGAPVVGFLVRCSCGDGIGQRARATSLGDEPSASGSVGVTCIDANVRESHRLPLALSSVSALLGMNSDGSEGLALDAAYLLGGTPGAGKSTFAMMLADAIQRAGIPPLYAISESTRTMYSLLARRTGYGLKLPLVFSRSVDEIIRVTESSGARFLILDQIHRLDPREDTLQHADKLVAFCKATGRGLLMVAERAKAGTTRGDHGIEYNCDVVLGLERRVISDESGNVARDERRWLVATKNRLGSEGSVALILGGRGWSEPPAEAEEPLLQ